MNKPSLIGRTLHHFEIQDELGRGGMAVVYRAHQTNLQRSVAIKVLPPEMTFDQSYIARFQQEARAAAGLEHSHIVPIYEVGEAEGFHYIVMKYIEGETLKEVIDRHAPMSVERVYELLEPIARALDYAHSRGVVHRDIKPSNVMINQDGWVFLTDFGLARGNTEGAAGLTQAGTIMGTPEYMSPEQAQGLTVGAPSDIYSLAIMAYQMLSKHTPFKGDNPQSILFARVMHAPTPISDYLPGVPVAVEDVLMRALARDPAKRFDSAKVFLTALREAGKQVSTSGQATIAVPAPHSVHLLSRTIHRQDSSRAIRRRAMGSRAANRATRHKDSSRAIRRRAMGSRAANRATRHKDSSRAIRRQVIGSRAASRATRHKDSSRAIRRQVIGSRAASRATRHKDSSQAIRRRAMGSRAANRAIRRQATCDLHRLLQEHNLIRHLRISRHWQVPQALAMLLMQPRQQVGVKVRGKRAYG